MNATKVFISWSGKPALGIARVWYDLLNDIFDDSVEIFFSDDIAAGKRGLDEIRRALEDAMFAIVIVTRENQAAQWLNFEAGAIANQLRVENGKSARVAPFLVDIERDTDVVGPIAQFQMKLFGREGIEQIVMSLASVIGATATTHQKRFSTLWDSEYLERFEQARKDVIDSEPGPLKASEKRPADDVLNEILSVVRELRSAPNLNFASLLRELAPTPTEHPETVKEAVEKELSTWSWIHDVNEPGVLISTSSRGSVTIRVIFDRKFPVNELLPDLAKDLEKIAKSKGAADARVLFSKADPNQY